MNKTDLAFAQTPLQKWASDNCEALQKFYLAYDAYRHHQGGINTQAMIQAFEAIKNPLDSPQV